MFSDGTCAITDTDKTVALSCGVCSQLIVGKMRFQTTILINEEAVPEEIDSLDVTKSFRQANVNPRDLYETSQQINSILIKTIAKCWQSGEHL